MNLPNKLTVLRIVLIPFMMFFYLASFIPHGIGKIVALAIFIIAALTDLLDGKIARKYNLVSDFGKFMDQIADKFITTTAMILVLFAGITYNWLAVLMLLIVVLRDILISGIRMFAASKNYVIPADIYGKVKSFFLDAGAMILMLYVGLREVATCEFVNYVKYFGLAILIVGVVLSIISCVNYSVKAVKVLTKKEDKEND